MRRALATTALAVALGGCGLKDPYSPTMPTNVARPQVAATAMTGVAAPVPRNANAPLAAAQAFMRGYVPYLYGLGRAAKIGAATSHLKRSLAAQPMTRDDGASPVHPRLEALRVLTRSGASARARAVVSDESRVYFAIDLALVRRAGGWQVAALRTNGG